MTNVTYVDGDTSDANLIKAAWLNDVGGVCYNLLGNGTIVPGTRGALLTNLQFSAYVQTLIAAANAAALQLLIAPPASWTPSIAFGGASVGVTYSVRQGNYCVMGNRLFFDAVLTLSAKGSSTGAATITGLPQACSTNGAAVSMQISAIAGAIDGVPSAVIASGASAVTLNFLGNAATSVAALADTNFGNTTALVVSGSYRVS